MADLFKEVGEPSRRVLLAHLRTGPKKVGELVALTGMKQPNVSNHLAKLRANGVVRATKLGRQVYYSLANAALVNTLTGLLGPDTTALEDCPLDTAQVKTFAKAAVQGDEASCTRTVDILLAQGRDIAEIYQKLFEPVMVLIGRWFEVEAVDEGQEHLASAIIERLMARALFGVPPAQPGAPVAVLGCAPGNWHSIGIRMVADILRSRGWLTLFLGANVPSKAFLAAVEHHRPDAVMVSANLEETRTETLELVRNLAQAQQGKVAVGGKAVADAREEFALAGADYAVSSLDEFITQVLPRLGP
ncbi:MAG: metalloregulator ArsR/SmtB family transcription factor [Fimbriimonadaceae bacterium]|nr:metalloregulator ArsR/SmtB family transcription factor [Fimbriimonadaceae bacterium]QYK55501.1 MAG: metalloregulator ArsR/SmtB family transcription factor [Fimbriimonadaceae bacterium]